jgi:hypothetical protein
LTSLEMARTCAELHCRRALLWRCILRRDARVRRPLLLCPCGLGGCYRLVPVAFRCEGS